MGLEVGLRSDDGIASPAPGKPSLESNVCVKVPICDHAPVRFHAAVTRFAV